MIYLIYTKGELIFFASTMKIRDHFLKNAKKLRPSYTFEIKECSLEGFRSIHLKKLLQNWEHL